MQSYSAGGAGGLWQCVATRDGSPSSSLASRCFEHSSRTTPQTLGMAARGKAAFSEDTINKENSQQSYRSPANGMR